MSNFYNTTNEDKSSVKEKKQKTEKQTEVIKQFFIANPFRLFTPLEIWRMLFPESVPPTSVRRSITDLTTEGVLVRTEEKKMEMYGSENFCWKLKVNDSNYIQGLLFQP